MVVVLGLSRAIPEVRAAEVVEVQEVQEHLDRDMLAEPVGDTTIIMVVLAFPLRVVVVQVASGETELLGLAVTEVTAEQD
ncbi:hypothetical protein COS86_05415 [Candidatus Bathyarchaeota archaeon CG07_land_8_20_14_0_80_47_9]|nr:MAG: hypothetical protein COS86_05415 [Candidatus Bathyarchaeota archaeon CG07_land_8_20_14_0_80_47_9]